MQAKINGKLVKPKLIESGVRQGYSLSPLIFIIVIDEIIQKLRQQGSDYKMGNKEIGILCYVEDDAVIVENEDLHI